MFCLIRDGVQIQSPRVTIVGFLAETLISDVIIRPEVRIVAGKKKLLKKKVRIRRYTQLLFVVGHTDLDSIYQVTKLILLRFLVLISCWVLLESPQTLFCYSSDFIMPSKLENNKIVSPTSSFVRSIHLSDKRFRDL